MHENLKKINESVENNKNDDTISFTILTGAGQKNIKKINRLLEYINVNFP